MKVSRHALIPFSDHQMFDLVLDVVRYPEFLPWCSAGQVLELDEHSQLAKLTISKDCLSKFYNPKSTDPARRDSFESRGGAFSFALWELVV
nr:hypothetical protein BFBNJELC_00007 [uncultured bacterium]